MTKTCRFRLKTATQHHQSMLHLLTSGKLEALNFKVLHGHESILALLGNRREQKITDRRPLDFHRMLHV